MNVPAELKYTKEHEWARIEGDIATIGITDYAQGELGDIVYLQLPEVGDTVTKDDSFGTIEAVKAVSDLYAPISGEVVAVNAVLQDTPETVNSNPYNEGWLIKIKINNLKEVDELLDSKDYEALI
ncbi:MAG: glycine cleavage system protein GcvH [Calditrichaeota bacterium]|nr:glycine cleavage system protein GcvH [Calditrichota bacterium]MCB0267110.1 glycine cleavage system protein GcvH [Calditrichota bacterium]MCB0298892.1 glycine cleavage system protein GcvH [Calditrichota bacterium]